MQANDPRCPKCDGQMEQGFSVYEHPRGIFFWHAGEPRKSFWTMIKLPKEKPIPIALFRCSRCGFLEAFARHEFEPS